MGVCVMTYRIEESASVFSGWRPTADFADGVGAYDAAVARLFDLCAAFPRMGFRLVEVESDTVVGVREAYWGRRA